MEVLPVGAECCMRTEGRTERQTDGRTDRRDVIVAFRSFAFAPKNIYEIA